MGVATEAQVANLKIGGRKLEPNEYVGAIDATMGANVTAMLNRLGIDLVAKFEELAPVGSGALASGIRVIGVRENAGAFRLEIGFDAEYTDYIDKGVRGVAPSSDHPRRQYQNKEGKIYQFKNYGMPPEALAGLKNWAASKGMQLQAAALVEQSNKSQKAGKKVPIRKIKKFDSGAGRLAYYIKKYGIEGRNFKQKAFDAIMPDYKVEFEDIGYNSLILKITK